MKGSPEAREIAVALARHCRKSLQTREAIVRTPWSERAGTGIVVTDPHWDSLHAHYVFGIARYERGEPVWRFNVKVPPNLDVRVEPHRMNADEEPPYEVTDCVMHSIDAVYASLERKRR